MMKYVTKAAAAVALAGGMLLGASVPANAAPVCCWTMTNSYATYSGCMAALKYELYRINASPRTQVDDYKPCFRDGSRYKYAIRYIYNM